MNRQFVCPNAASMQNKREFGSELNAKKTGAVTSELPMALFLLLELYTCLNNFSICVHVK